MFFVTGDYSVTFITADQLRIELKAGGLNQKQEDHVIGHILQSSEKGEVGDLVLTSVRKTDGSCTFDYNSHGSLKTRLHRRFCRSNSMQIFVALKLQLQNRKCKPGAIFSAICLRDIAGVSNMFELPRQISPV